LLFAAKKDTTHMEVFPNKAKMQRRPVCISNARYHAHFSDFSPGLE